MAERFLRNLGHMQLAAVAFAAGAGAAISLKPGAFSAGSGILLAIGGAWVSSTPLAFGAAGWVAAAATGALPGPLLPGDSILQGEVVSVPRTQDERARFLLSDLSRGRVEVSAPDLAAPLAPGDQVLLSAELRESREPRNPGGRDGAFLAAAHGISAQAWTRNPPARTAPPSPLSAVTAARFRFGTAATAHLPPAEAALVRAIGAGDESQVDPATRERFARSGLAHVLSVSGLHLAVVALGAWRALQALLLRLRPLASRFDVRRGAAAACLPVTALYAVATGATVPVLRSAVAAGLVFGAAVLGRGNDPASALAVASVAGLVALAGPLREALPVAPDRARWAGRALEAALQGACASAAATL